MCSVNDKARIPALADRSDRGDDFILVKLQESIPTTSWSPALPTASAICVARAPASAGQALCPWQTSPRTCSHEDN